MSKKQERWGHEYTGTPEGEEYPRFPLLLQCYWCLWNWPATSLFRMTSCEGLACFMQPEADKLGKQITAELPGWSGACTWHSSLVSYYFMHGVNMSLISDRYCVITLPKTMGILFLQIYSMMLSVQPRIIYHFCVKPYTWHWGFKKKKKKRVNQGHSFPGIWNLEREIAAQFTVYYNHDIS